MRELNWSAHNTPKTEEIEEQAARFLVQLTHDPDTEARGAFARWIEADPVHAVAYARMEAAWESAERLKAQGGFSDFEPSAEAAGPEEAARPTRRRFLIGGAVAASAVGATVMWTRGGGDYQTGVGEVRNITLSDGSVLHLNTDSHVKVEYQARRRILRLLRGEAYFDVAHDPSRPFDVQARGAVVRALGTAFNVRLRDSLVELTVTKGVVGVRTASAPMEKVPAGGCAVIRPRTVAVGRLDGGTMDQRVAWRENMIELDGQSVEQAVDEFNRYRALPMVIGDQRVASLRIGGRFRTDESDQFLAALEQTLPIRVVTGADKTVLLLYRDDAG